MQLICISGQKPRKYLEFFFISAGILLVTLLNNEILCGYLTRLFSLSPEQLICRTLDLIAQNI